MTDTSRPKRRSVNPDFVDPLPQASRDERGDDSPYDEDERDRWLRENKPPHHA